MNLKDLAEQFGNKNWEELSKEFENKEVITKYFRELSIGQSFYLDFEDSIYIKIAEQFSIRFYKVSKYPVYNCYTSVRLKVKTTEVNL